MQVVASFQASWCFCHFIPFCGTHLFETVLPTYPMRSSYPCTLIRTSTDFLYAPAKPAEAPSAALPANWLFLWQTALSKAPPHGCLPAKYAFIFTILSSISIPCASCATVTRVPVISRWLAKQSDNLVLCQSPLLIEILMNAVFRRSTARPASNHKQMFLFALLFC